MTQADNHTRMFDPYWYPFRLFSKLQFRQLLNLEGIAHQWILPRGLQENTSTRSRGSASPVSCSRALLSALRPLNSRPWSTKMCSRYLRVSTDWTYSHINMVQNGATHGPTRRIKVCICVLNHWGQSFSAIPESKWTGSSKHWQAPMLFPQMQHADALFLWRCFKCSAFTGLNWTRIYDLSWHERLKLMGNKPTRNRTSASVPQRQWNCAGSSDSASGQTWIKSFGN